MSKRPLSPPEVRELMGARDHLVFLSTRNEVYREHGMAQAPPTREQAAELIAQHPNLLRRPILSAGGEVVFGFDEAAYRRLVGVG